MLGHGIIKSEARAVGVVLAVLLISAANMFAAGFNASSWPSISKEEFSAAPLSHKTAWMQRLHADTNLEAPGNTKALEILIWGLRDHDAEVRKMAARATVLFLTKLRNVCRGKNLGKLPIKREVITEIELAINENFESPDLLVRSDAVISHIWLRGSGDKCAEVALKLMSELSRDVTEQWGRREAILNLMTNTGFKGAELPLSYLHPNSRKAGEPLTGTKLVPIKYKENDNTWFDFLENSLP